MGVGAGLYMYDVVVKSSRSVTFAISSPDGFLFFQEDRALLRMHCACNTVQLLQRSRIPFSWTMPSQQPRAKRIDYKI